jgi:hypothetical protein
MFQAQKIRLLTRAGVTDALVGTFIAPPFVVMPDVVTWRDRVFNKTDRTVVESDGSIVAEYSESFSFVIGDYLQPLEATERRAAGVKST